MTSLAGIKKCNLSFVFAQIWRFFAPICVRGGRRRLCWPSRLQQRGPVVQTSSVGLAWLQARLLAAVCILYSSSLTVSQSARAWTKRRHEDECGANVKAERSKTLVAQVKSFDFEPLGSWCSLAHWCERWLAKPLNKVTLSLWFLATAAFVTVLWNCVLHYEFSLWNVLCEKAWKVLALVK